MEKLRAYQAPLSVAAAALATASVIAPFGRNESEISTPKYHLTAHSESYEVPESDGKIASRLASQIAVSRAASIQLDATSYSLTGPHSYKKPDVSKVTNFWFGTPEGFKQVEAYAKQSGKGYVIENAKILYVVAKANGLTNKEIGCADNIPVLESLFDHQLPNSGGDGGWGIGQATPGNKMAKYGPNWRHNIMTQIYWYLNYTGAGRGDSIKGRFGDVCSAWDARHNQHMY